MLAAPAWLLLGVLVLLYVIGMVVFALLVVLTALGRLVLGPVLGSAPGRLLRALRGLLRSSRRGSVGA